MAEQVPQYCRANGSSSHEKACFREYQSCPKEEHVHDEHCYTISKKRKCPYKSIHTHGAGCVSRMGPLCGGT